MQSRLTILTFHHLDDSRSPLCFPPSVFRAGLQHLRDSGYRTIPLREAADLVRAGQGFPDRSFVLTFDDGFRSAHDVALPVLAELGMTATVFLSTGSDSPASGRARLPSIDAREMLSWDEIRRMCEEVFDPAVHTMTHPDLSRLGDDQVRAEITGAKCIVDRELSRTTDLFAYPFGRYNRAVRAGVAERFTAACSVQLGQVTRNSDPYALQRVDAYYLRTARLFGLMLSKAFGPYLAARRIPRRIRQVLGRRP